MRPPAIRSIISIPLPNPTLPHLTRVTVMGYGRDNDDAVYELIVEYQDFHRESVAWPIEQGKKE